MFDGATKKFLESDNALIVATVSPSGEPHATRGWGVTVLPGEDRTLRLLLAADDAVALAHLADGGAIAITGADVRTFRSMQVKGRAVAIEPGTDADRARAARFVEQFFGAVMEVDGALRHQISRLEPVDYVACTVVVDDTFDQTPGPGAGGRVSEEAE